MTTSRRQCSWFSTPQCARTTWLSMAFRRECRAEQVIGHLGGGLVGGITNADDPADGREAGPFMMLLQPADVGADRRRAGLDTAVIAIDNRSGRGGAGLRIVEEVAHSIMQRALVAL